MAFINWTEIDSPEELITIGTLIMAAIVGYTGYFWGVLRGKAVKIYKERLDAVEEETKQCRLDHKHSLEQHNETKQEMKKIQGQLLAYKEIPLKEINETIKMVHKEVNEVAKSVPGMIRNQRDIIKMLDGKKDK